MNLVKQFKAFGDLVAEHSIPMDVQALYYNIMQLFNRNMWPESLVIETYKLEENCQMTRKRISACREYLVQNGIISYAPARHASGSPTYELVFLYETHKAKNVFPHETQEEGSVFPTETPSVSQGNTKETPSVSPRNTLYKTLKRENIKTTEAKASGGSPVKTKKKNEKKSVPRAEKNLLELQATPHWTKMVDVWFVFYEEKFMIKPSFSGQDPRSLKQICDNLQKRSLEKRIDWTEQQAINVLKAFLSFAHNEEWLKKNFLLPNLNRQFDKIISNAGNKQFTGVKGAMASALDKIDRAN